MRAHSAVDVVLSAEQPSAHFIGLLISPGRLESYSVGGECDYPSTTFANPAFYRTSWTLCSLDLGFQLSSIRQPDGRHKALTAYYRNLFVLCHGVEVWFSNVLTNHGISRSRTANSLDQIASRLVFVQLMIEQTRASAAAWTAPQHGVPGT
jgi:hypothetical protein